MKHLVLISASFLLTGFTSVGLASVNLPIGAGPVALPGTAVAAEIDLGGTVVYDKLIPFEIKSAAGTLLFKGDLQNRVVKSNRGDVLHFYYAIRNTKRGLNGIVRNVYTRDFSPTPAIEVDWRPDGLGLINPVSALRSAGTGALIRYSFPAAGPQLVGGTDSKFFYIKTKALNFINTGRTMIQLSTGQSAVLVTMSPKI